MLSQSAREAASATTAPPSPEWVVRAPPLFTPVHLEWHAPRDLCLFLVSQSSAPPRAAAACTHQMHSPE